MQGLVILIRIAGAVQACIFSANFLIPAKLRCRENLSYVTPMVRSIFIVHWAYILLVLAIFSVLCFGFAPELAGASLMGRFLSAAIALFWVARLPIQLFIYDRELRRQHRVADIAMVSALVFLAVVFGAAALGVKV
jgi:hypothetical protein